VKSSTPTPVLVIVSVRVAEPPVASRADNEPGLTAMVGGARVTPAGLLEISLELPYSSMARTLNQYVVDAVRPVISIVSGAPAGAGSGASVAGEAASQPAWSTMGSRAQRTS